MLVIVAYSLAEIYPAQILIWLPTITVILKFLAALIGFSMVVVPPVARAFRRVRASIGRRRDDRGRRS
ncbi:hypothetical protein [Micromonospora sp. WMMD998]|uniref:hypothetical protein n=1 Tax=Micromonospora sp. WMMD998 TaxID=3016092 RepID=UPI00249A404A|nr:hypothetical protein [Micromonospora sp. WMMD998]WFE39944.1 hypothetical protein O7619_16495 [Micromonospora sp. WMMD998]